MDETRQNKLPNGGSGGGRMLQSTARSMMYSQPVHMRDTGVLGFGGDNDTMLKATCHIVHGQCSQSTSNIPSCTRAVACSIMTCGARTGTSKPYVGEAQSLEGHHIAG